MKLMLVLPLAGLFLAGCSAISESSSDSTPSPDTPTPPLATATAAPPRVGSRTAPAATASPVATRSGRDEAKLGGPNRPVDQPATGTTTATLKQVNIRSVAGVESITFDFGGVIPGYHVEYAANPTQCGSGKPMPLPAGAVAAIVVRFSPAQAHDEAGKLTIPNTVLTSTGPVILGATEICDFEGVVTWAIPVTSNRVFVVGETGQSVSIVPSSN